MRKREGKREIREDIIIKKKEMRKEIEKIARKKERKKEEYEKNKN